MTIYWKTTKESGCELKLFIFTSKTFSGVVNCLTTSKFAKRFFKWLATGQWNVLLLKLVSGNAGVDISNSALLSLSY